MSLICVMCICMYGAIFGKTVSNTKYIWCSVRICLADIYVVCSTVGNLYSIYCLQLTLLCLNLVAPPLQTAHCAPWPTPLHAPAPDSLKCTNLITCFPNNSHLHFKTWHSPKTNKYLAKITNVKHQLVNFFYFIRHWLWFANGFRIFFFWFFANRSVMAMEVTIIDLSKVLSSVLFSMILNKQFNT